MRVARVLLAAVVAAVLLAAASAIALFSLDLGPLSGPLTRWASAQLGRELVIDGPVSIRAGRTLRFNAGGVRLANATWGSRGDMLRVRQLAVEIDTASLWDRPVIIRQVGVVGLDLLLERRADGASNWEFRPDLPDAAAAWPDSLPVVVDRVSMSGAQITFSGPRLERPLELRFDSLEQQRVPGGMLELAGQGTANGEPLSLDATAGPFTQLVAGRDFSVGLDGRLGELSIAANIRVDDIARPVNTLLDLKVRGPGADYLTTRFGVRNLGAGPLALDAVVRPAADGVGIQGEITGEVGAFVIKASGELADPTGLHRLQAKVDLSGPDLSFAGGLAGIGRLPVEPFQLKADVERAGDVVRISDAVLTVPGGRATVSGTISRFDELAGNDLRFRVEGTDVAPFRELLRLPSAFTGAFEVAGGLKASGAGELLDLKATTTLGNLAVAGPLGEQPDYYGTRLTYTASGPNLARAGAIAGLANLPGPEFRAAGELEWTADGVVLRNGDLRAGTDRLGVDGLIAREPLGPGTDVTWKLSGPNLHRLAKTFRIAGLPAAPFDLRGRLRRETKVSRLDDVQGTVAGASVRLSGRVADTPRLGTTLDLAVDGPRLEAFAGLWPDYTLPTGEFRVAGGVSLKPKRLELRSLKLAAAGAQGTVDADIALPLGSSRGEFSVVAKGRNVARFLPRLGSAPVASVPFDLRVRGRARGSAWELDEGQFNVGAATITASGKLDLAPDFSATALKVTVKAEDLAVAGRLVALTLPSLPLDLAAEFTGTPTAFRVERASGRLGSTDFDGGLKLDLRDRPVLDVDLRSDFLDLTPFLDEAEPPAAASAALVRGPGRRRQSPRLIPDTAVPLGWLAAIDGSLALKARRALVAGIALDDLRLAASLRNGMLTLDSMELKAPPDGRLTFSGGIDSRAPVPTLRLAGSGRGVRLARLDDTPAVRDARPRGDIELSLSGEGATWRELAASLDGRLRLVTGSGAIPATSMNLLFGNLWRDTVVAVMPGMASRGTTNVRCLAAFISVAGGQLRTVPALVMQTDKVNVIAHGSVDLATEKLELFLNTAPRRGRVDVTISEIVNPYIKVTGTLASPGLSVDPKGVLFSGGAAVATAGITILARGVWDRLFRADDPCAAASAEAARLETGGPEPRKWLIPRLPGR